MLNPSKLKRYIGRCFVAGICLIIISCGQGMSEQQMLENAKSYMLKGELMAASIELRNTLQKNSKNAQARYLLGTINLDIGDLASAEKEFQRAALAGWSNEETQTNIAHIFITRKEFQKLLDEIVIIDSWSAETRANISAMRAMAHAGLGHTAQAITALDKARAENANAFQVLKATAIFQLSEIEDGDSSVTLNKALSLYPENTELLLLLASERIQNNNLTQATDTFKKVISLDPANIITANGRVAHIGLARLQIIEKNYAEANSTLARLLKRNDKDPDANYLAGILALNQGDYHLAEDHIRKLMAVAPDHVQSQQVMGKIKYALKDFDQAAHHLSVFLNTNPDDFAARKLLTNTYLILKQPEEARSTLHNALTARPDDAETLVLLSQIEFTKGDLKAGIQSLNKAIQSSPNNIALHKQLAKTYIATGQMERALSEIKIFHKLSKDTEETRKLGVSAYLKSGEIDKAIKVANMMLKNKPKDPDTIALNGSLYSLNDKRQQARSYFNQALQLQEKLPSATMGLARLEVKEGNFDKAKVLFNDLIEANSGGIVPMLALSELAAQQNNTDEMLSWLERARNAAPTETKPRIVLATYYLRINQPDKANIYIQEAIKGSPEHVELLALQGKALIMQKKYNKALEPLNKLINKLPESTQAQVLLGEAFLHQGMLDQAREHLQKVLDKQNKHVFAMSLMAEAEFKEGNYDKTLEYTKQLQKEKPELSIGYLLEGNTWMAKQDNKKAHSAFSIAWKYHQTAALAIRLFTTSQHTANIKDAVKPLLTWLEAHPDDDSTRFFLATAYQNAEENDSAIKQYEKILKQQPENVSVLNNLAWLYSLQENPKALDLAERAYRLTQTNPAVLDTYGWILVQQKQPVKGQRLIEQAMEQIPDSLEIQYHYAVALIKSGNNIEGHQILKKLLKQDKPFVGRNEAEQLLAKQITSRELM